VYLLVPERTDSSSFDSLLERIYKGWRGGLSSLLRAKFTGGIQTRQAKMLL